jgi:hypothetical protein
MLITTSYALAHDPAATVTVERTRLGNWRVCLRSATAHALLELYLSPAQAATLAQQLAAGQREGPEGLAAPIPAARARAQEDEP